MIAISYRRDDSLPIAGRLYDRLEAEFGKANVFMDFDSIPYGVNFREHIRDTITRAELVIAVIGPNWIGGRGGANARIADSGDFVRLEIAYALAQAVPIIPVLVNHASMPATDQLPRDLEALVDLNALTLDTGVDFHHHASRLIGSIRHLKREPKGPKRNPASNGGTEKKTNNWMLILVAVSLLIGSAALTFWHFAPEAPSIANTVSTKTQGVVVSPTPALVQSPGPTRPTVSSPPNNDKSSPTATANAKVSPVERLKNPDEPAFQALIGEWQAAHHRAHYYADKSFSITPARGSDRERVRRDDHTKWWVEYGNLMEYSDKGWIVGGGIEQVSPSEIVLADPRTGEKDRLRRLSK